MTAVIYSTIGDIEDARRIAHTLVEEKLVACVNIIPRIESVYRWEGKLEEDKVHLPQFIRSIVVKVQY